MRQLHLALAALVVLAGAASAVRPGPPPPAGNDPGEAPLFPAAAPNPATEAKVKKTIIVVYKPDAADPVVADTRAQLAAGLLKARAPAGPPLTIGATFKVDFVESDEFERGGEAAALVALLSQGGAADLPPGAVGELARQEAQLIRGKGAVDYMEPDGLATIAQTLMTQQAGATWGIDRTDQAQRPLSGTYNYFTSAGSGTTVYVVDTGILTMHPNFNGRAVWGYDATGAGATTDDNGHGTHVAGTVGSETYGIAKNTTLVAVKVLDAAGSGAYSWIIGGINWVIQDCPVRNPTRRCVINMSLGGGLSSALNTAVESAVSAGVVVAVAAGNSNADACRYSPAAAPSALTVASTTSADALSSFSNYGRCVDVCAPGSTITSTYYNGGYASMSGTSMASPHVAGAAALLWGESPTATPAQVINTIKTKATAGVVAMSTRNQKKDNRTPKNLLFTGALV